MEKFIHDLDWINRQLQDFAARVAFLIVAKRYQTLKNFNTIPFFERLMDSMYNTALLIAGILYDNGRGNLSIYFLLKRVQELPLLASSRATPSGVHAIQKKIKAKKNLVDRVIAPRNKLFAHSDLNWSRRADFNRNVSNASPSQYQTVLTQHVRDMRTMLPREEELKELLEFTILLMRDIKNLLGAPDTIFSSCRNDREWELFYKARVADAEKYFKIVTAHDWR